MRNNNRLELIEKIGIDSVGSETIFNIEKSVKDLVKEIDFFGSKIILGESLLVENRNNWVVNRSSTNHPNNEICFCLEQKATFNDSFNNNFKHGVGYQVETYLNSNLEVVSLAIRNFKGKIKYYLDNESVNKITFKNNLNKSLNKVDLSVKKKIKI